MIARTLACVLGLLLLIPVASAAPRPAPANVVRATLSNGLRVVIVRNTLAPVVSTAVNYLVGSDEAPQGFPGTAHAQEHMMFRGGPGLSADQLADIGSLLGGDFNANTRESLTQYLYTVPAQHLDVALNIEATRMRGVTDSEADWDKERGAIEQEVAQDLSSPFYVMYEKVRAAMFAGTPYEHDALGTRPSFDATNAAMLKKFHDAWYAPNNAVLVIVGDVDPQAVLGKVKRLFGGIPSKVLPPRPHMTFGPVEPRSFTLPTDQPEAGVVVAMRLPGLDSPDLPALEVLADILQSQRSPLYDLVVKGQATATTFAVSPLPKAGLAYAVAEFPASGDAAAMQERVRAILAQVARDGVSPDLVMAAKRDERRQTEFQKNSIAQLASVWSDAIALYHLPSPEADLARINKVTVADVNRVARTYLDLNHAITTTMLPEPSGRPVASSAGFGGQESINLGEGKSVSLPDWARKDLAQLTPPVSTLNPTVTKLANGLTLIVQPENVSDSVTVLGHVRNRPETEEPDGQEGVSTLLDRLFSYGTDHLDRVAFQAALDQIGANEQAGTTFSVQVLTENFERGVALLADNELHPALPAAELAILKGPLAAQVEARNHSPGYLTTQSLRAALYPAGDPSLRQATSQTVLGLTREDVEAYYERTFRPDLTTIVVIGNISPERARTMIEKYFASWHATGPLPPTELPSSPDNASHVVSVPDSSRVQDRVYVGQTLAMNRTDPDYYALALGNAVLGGGFYSARLSKALRKDSGLVYSVSSGLQAGRSRSVYLVQYASDPGNVEKAAAIVAREIANMQTSPVAEEELQRAKALLLRQMSLEDADVDGIADAFISRLELNLPLDEPRIAAHHYLTLTPENVEGAFRKWMRPGDLVRTSEGPAM